MRALTLSCLVLLFAAARADALDPCTNLGPDGQRIPRSVDFAFYAHDCPPSGKVQVRLFDKRGMFIKLLEVEPGKLLPTPTFFPEQQFVAMPGSSGCVQGDALRDGGPCMGRFNFACVKTAVIDIEVAVDDGVEVEVSRELTVVPAPDRKDPPKACVDAVETLLAGDAITTVIDGEKVKVTVRRPGKAAIQYWLDLRNLRRGKPDQPPTDVMMAAGKAEGQTGGPISANQAQKEAERIRFVRRREGR